MQYFSKIFKNRQVLGLSSPAPLNPPYWWPEVSSSHYAQKSPSAGLSAPSASQAFNIGNLLNPEKKLAKICLVVFEKTHTLIPKMTSPSRNLGYFNN